MARPIDEISAAWRALAGHSSAEGWRSIPVSPSGSCDLMAARYFPSNLEALLVGFDGVLIPPAERLPEGTGFVVTKVDAHNGDKGRVWLALSRQESGSLDLFATMVADVAGAMDLVSTGDATRLLRIFLGRVKGWQEFMRKGAPPLGAEAEVGLVGELSFLSLLLDQGITSLAAVEAWQGPLDGVHDFILGTGAVEVKTTIAKTGFLAKIGSLEQLDDSVRTPLFVAGQRLWQTERGRRLPEWVQQLCHKLGDEGAAKALFSERLLSAGYVDAHADFYTRRFAEVGTQLLEVGLGFPRIIPGTVPKGIRKALYEIDLDQAGATDLKIADVLKRLGVI
jgi:hypothetical protein